MTQEDKRYLQDKLYHERDKELLLKDLCARIPYGAKVESIFINPDTKEHKSCGIEVFDATSILMIRDGLGEFKPHLFPLSSITEKQRNDISKLLIDTQKEYSPYGELNMKGCDNLFICTVKQANVLINYCLTHHLDINGLIEKSLALDATNLGIYE